MINLRNGLGALLLLLFAGSASAVPTPTFIFKDTNPGGSSRGGDLSHIRTSYNEGASKFLWEYTISTENSQGVEHDGFWLVVNDGSNPKGHTNLAILYGDLQGDNVTAYQYNGLNNKDSYEVPGTFIQSWQNVFDIQQSADGSETSVSLMLNVENVNSSGGIDWQGIFYDEKVGIWFHPTAGASFSYNNGGETLASFNSGRSGWYDVGYKATREVSSPGVGVLLAAGLLGFGLVSRRRAAAS